MAMKAVKVVKKKKVGGAFNPYGSEGPTGTFFQ